MEIRPIRNLSRFRQIVFVLLKYGFDDVIQRLDLPGSVFLRRIRRIPEGLTVNERIRMVFEDLGPTFIKFGQVLSMRPDLIPGPLVEELRKLQDRVPATPFKEIREMVEKNLKKTLGEVFSAFEESPIGSASLAQVHRAVLVRENLQVAVKVQRPRIRPLIRADLDILAYMAQRLNERKAYHSYDFPGLVSELRYSLLRELDFSWEKRNMEIIAKNFRDQDHLFVPRVFGDYSNPFILTMEFIEGVPLSGIDTLRLDRHQLAQKGSQVLLKQILEDGFFHADPHDGNLRWLTDGRLCFLDWGMVGRLTEGMRNHLLDFLAAILEEDIQEILKLGLAFADSYPREINMNRLEREVRDLLDAYGNVPLKDLQVGRLLLEIATVLREHRVRIRPDYALMSRSLLTIEDVAKRLDPEFNALEAARPLVRNLIRSRWEPQTLLKKSRKNLTEILDILLHSPSRFNRLFKQMEEGAFQIKFNLEGLRELNRILENFSNRLTFGIIIAALIIGSSMIITTGVRPFLFGFPALGIIGYLVSGLLGLWLVINILRSRRY